MCAIDGMLASLCAALLSTLTRGARYFFCLRPLPPSRVFMIATGPSSRSSRYLDLSDGKYFSMHTFSLSTWLDSIPSMASDWRVPPLIRYRWLGPSNIII